MAAVRETREELGLQVKIARLLGTVTFGTATQMYFEVCTTLQRKSVRSQR